MCGEWSWGSPGRGKGERAGPGVPLPHSKGAGWGLSHRFRVSPKWVLGWLLYPRGLYSPHRDPAALCPSVEPGQRAVGEANLGCSCEPPPCPLSGCRGPDLPGQPQTSRPASPSLRAVSWEAGTATSRGCCRGEANPCAAPSPPAPCFHTGQWGVGGALLGSAMLPGSLPQVWDVPQWVCWDPLQSSRVPRKHGV